MNRRSLAVASWALALLPFSTLATHAGDEEKCRARGWDYSYTEVKDGRRVVHCRKPKAAANADRKSAGLAPIGGASEARANDPPGSIPEGKSDDAASFVPAGAPSRPASVPPALILLIVTVGISWLLWQRLLGGWLIGEARREIHRAVALVVLAAVLYEGWMFATAMAAASRWAAQARTTATQIANGHAFDKHVVKRGEFPDITTREDFATFVSRIINQRAEVRSLPRGRTAYWHDSSGTLVIVDPAHRDGGTAFRPTDGKQYFLDLGKAPP